MIKKERKDLYQPLTLDKIIESCLILMVLLLLTRARHLIVKCTASKSPYIPSPFPADATRWRSACQPVVHPLHSPPSPFLNCLPSVIRSVTSPVILPRVCKSWLFVLKHVNLMEVRRLFLPPLQKTIKILKMLQRGGESEGR